MDDDLNSLALDAALTLDARAELQVRAGVMGYAAADRKWRARNVRIAIRAPFLAFADVRHINEINRMMFLGDRPSPQKYAYSAVLA